MSQALPPKPKVTQAEARAPSAGGLAELRFDILAVVASRAFMFALLFWVAFGKESLARGLALVYGVSTILYLGTWIWAYRATRVSPVGFLLYFQFLLEILVEAGIFFTNQGYLSDYGLLFILTILSGGLCFRFLGSLTMASLAALVLGIAGLAHLGWTGPFGLVLPRLLDETIQVRFFLYTTLFYMVAILSSLLSRRLAEARKELEGTHQALDLYQLSAESMMNDLPTGLVFFDNCGFLKYKNRFCEELLGKPLEAGMERDEVLRGVVSPQVLGWMEKLKERFPYTEFEVDLDTRRSIHVQIKTLSRQDRYLGCVFILMDFTNERKMARTLLRAERMAALGGMSAKIAHEIRNPLASISGSAQMLRDLELSEDEERKLMGLIVSESARLDRILTDLLNYVRERTPSYRSVSIAPIFQKIKTMIEKNSNFKKELVFISQFIENGNIQFISDQDILIQVLLNIGLNALHSLPTSGGTIEFSARRRGGDVALQIKDTGCGMALAEQGRAFEPFYTTKPGGSGLGLATSLLHVQTLEGNITLESETGSGTTVTISLPDIQRRSELEHHGDKV